MSSWMQVDWRCREPEIMDDPGLSRERHLAALRGLERINRWSRSVSIVWSAIRGLAQVSPSEPLRVLDVATGAGDVPIYLLKRAQRAGVQVHVDASDANPTALEHARRRAAQVGASVRFFPLDVLRDNLPTEYDVLVSSLFLHHLAEESALLLLRKMADSARRLVVVNDLLRSRRGLALAYLGPRILTSSDVVRVDAIRSVRAAFSLAEIAELANRAGLGEAVVRRCWPHRLLLTWRR